jgi:hypothetical protein
MEIQNFSLRGRGPHGRVQLGRQGISPVAGFGFLFFK